MDEVYDAKTGLIGGRAFGDGIAALAAIRNLDAGGLAAACGIEAATMRAVLAGAQRVAAPFLAVLARVLRVRPIEFMQKTGLLSLDVYAAGLDPLFFLPDGSVRHDARIYMREINPRHAVPEIDMTRRNPVLRALADDALLDAEGKLEVEFAYLLRAAAAATSRRL